MMRRWCWHDWGKWEDTELVSTAIYIDGERHSLDVDAQERRCTKCGKARRRRVKVVKG